MVDVKRGTLGIIVARLLPAMNDEKHIGAMDATANNKKTTPANPPVWAMAESKWKSGTPFPCAPATASSGKPPATNTAKRTPTQTAPAHVAFITAIGSEIHARRSGGGEKSDHNLHHHHEAPHTGSHERG